MKTIKTEPIKIGENEDVVYSSISQVKDDLWVFFGYQEEEGNPGEFPRIIHLVQGEIAHNGVAESLACVYEFIFTPLNDSETYRLPHVRTDIMNER